MGSVHFPIYIAYEDYCAILFVLVQTGLLHTMCEIFGMPY